MCAPAHQIDVHGGATKGEKGTHYVHACRLDSCACVRSCVLERRALECTYKLSRHAHEHA
jgi:hypothetical protein